MLRTESWAVVATAALGITAAIMAFLRTPPERRMRLVPPSVQQRLADSPPEARAVIIHADRRRAFRRDLPWLIATLPMAAFALWFQATHGDACASLFGVGRTRLAVGAFFVVPPLLLVMVLLQAARQATKVFRGGYWPPLDTPVYIDTLATSGPRVRWRAIGILVLTAVALATLAYGYLRSAQFVGVNGAWDLVAAKEAACAAAR